MISIVMPAYNAGEYIDRAISSIVQQTYEEFEFIIIDDCSTDDTLEKCKKWEESDRRIVVIVNDNNLGQGESRNIGLLAAHGDYIYFCDADDFVEQNILEVLVNEITAKDVDVVCCDYWQYNWRPDIRRYEKILSCCEFVDDKEILNIDSRPDMPDFFPCVMWNKLYKKEVFTNIRFLKEKLFFEDFYVNCLAMLERRKFIYLHRALYHYYASNASGSNSNAKIEKMTNDLMFVFQKLNARFENEKNYEKYACAFMNHARSSLKFHLSKLDYSKKLLKEKEIDESIDDFFNRTYTKFQNKGKIYAFGSFGLRQALHKIPYSFEHISYMKMESAIKNTSDLKEVNVMGNNSFRTNVLVRDVNKNLMDIWSDVAPGSYLVIDLLDERLSGVWFEERVVTKSEFFDGYIIRNCLPYEIIKEDPSTWREIIKKFVNIIYKLFDDKKIIIVKNRLSKGYGFYKYEQGFDNIQLLEEMNGMIEAKEKILLEEMPDAYIVEIPEELNFTFCRHSFGTEPYYHNYRWYHYVAQEIEKRIEE